MNLKFNKSEMFSLFVHQWVLNRAHYDMSFGPQAELPRSERPRRRIGVGMSLVANSWREHGPPVFAPSLELHSFSVALAVIHTPGIVLSVLALANPRN
jgi:hypothetical protein